MGLKPPATIPYGNRFIDLKTKNIRTGERVCDWVRERIQKQFGFRLFDVTACHLLRGDEIQSYFQLSALEKETGMYYICI